MDAEKKRAGLERRDFLRVMGAGAAGAAAAVPLLAAGPAAAVETAPSARSPSSVFFIGSA